jgi:orotidine-5'-phosphate decarboxylase
MTTVNPVYCAVDTIAPETAQALGRGLVGLVGGIKLGLEFFVANGPAGVRAVSAGGLPLFLDLKLHDIPNTVAGAIKAMMPLAPAMTTVHAGGGAEMVRAAVDAAGDAAAGCGVARPCILAVTVLTSLNQDALAAVGVAGSVLDQAKRLAALAQQSGADGVVCSAHEVEALRLQCGPHFRLVVPGIRPAGAAVHDQKRVLNPGEALARGADVLVIGRPITAAVDPVAAARQILEEIGDGPCRSK